MDIRDIAAKQLIALADHEDLPVSDMLHEALILREMQDVDITCLDDYAPITGDMALLAGDLLAILFEDKIEESDISAIYDILTASQEGG